MIIRIPLTVSRQRLKFLLGLALFVFAATQINAAYFWPVLAAWLIHEGGHLVVGRLLDVRLQLQSGWLGVGLKSENTLRPMAAVLVAVAGPVADLLWFAAASVCGWQDYALAAVVLAVINLLPVLPLDGGRALVALNRRYGAGLRLTTVLAYGGQVFALVLAMMIIGFNMRLWLLILPAVIFILAAGEDKKAMYSAAAETVSLWKNRQ